MKTPEHQVRTVVLQREELESIITGSLHVVASIRQDWAVGLIADTRADPDDERYGEQLQADGYGVLRLTDTDLVDLLAGRALTPADSTGRGYLISMSDVEDNE